MASSWVLGAGALLETPSLFLGGTKRRPQGAPGVCTNGTGQGLCPADYLSEHPEKVSFIISGRELAAKSSPGGKGESLRVEWGRFAASPAGGLSLLRFGGEPCCAGNSGGNSTDRCSGVGVGREAFLLVAPPFPRAGERGCGREGNLGLVQSSG